LDPSLLGELSESLRGGPLVVVSPETTSLFTKIFNELKAKFISSNEYGLDSYLSVWIRHGTLAGQIRSVFERQHLITRRDATGNRYHRNEYWINRLEIYQWDVEEFDECF